MSSPSRELIDAENKARGEGKRGYDLMTDHRVVRAAIGLDAYERQQRAISTAK